MKSKKSSNKIRYYRRLLDWTQTQLAEGIGLESINGQVYISKYERGVQRTPKRLKPKIASVLGLPEEVIFPDDTGSPGGNRKW
jgi:transcriptional regulator with XRE-family HTH domain